MSRNSSVYYTRIRERNARFNSVFIEITQNNNRNIYALIKLFDLVSQKLYPIYRVELGWDMKKAQKFLETSK